MIERVMVPLDGSELSEQAVPYATGLARRTGARLELVRVVYLGAPSLIAAYPIRPEQMEQARASVHQECTNYLRPIANRLRATGLDVSSTVEEGEPAEAIVKLAAEVPGTVTAMSTHGHSGVSRWLLGSVADKVLRSTDTPLMLVRSRLGEGIPSEFDAKSIIVPLDGSAPAEQAVKLAGYLGRVSSIPVALLRAVSSSREIHGQIEHYAHLAAGAIEPADAQALGYLDGVKRRMVEDEVPDVRTIVAHGGAAETILQMADETPDSLVVMTTHGRTGLGRWILGSIADRVVRHSVRPVLLVPAHSGA